MKPGATKPCDQFQIKNKKELLKSLCKDVQTCRNFGEIVCKRPLALKREFVFDCLYSKSRVLLEYLTDFSSTVAPSISQT